MIIKLFKKKDIRFFISWNYWFAHQRGTTRGGSDPNRRSIYFLINIMKIFFNKCAFNPNLFLLMKIYINYWNNRNIEVFHQRTSTLWAETGTKFSWRISLKNSQCIISVMFGFPCLLELIFKFRDAFFFLFKNLF